jgi:hypothetical protein
MGWGEGELLFEREGHLMDHSFFFSFSFFLNRWTIDLFINDERNGKEKWR